MIRRLINRIRLHFYPPETHDVYWADAFMYLAGKPTEHILHGLRDRHGDPRAEPVHGKFTYRLTIMSCSMPYYLVQCQVLASDRRTYEKRWAFRSQHRRIDKKEFVRMILDGEIEKDEQI